MVSKRIPNYSLDESTDSDEFSTTGAQEINVSHSFTQSLASFDLASPPPRRRRAGNRKRNFCCNQHTSKVLVKEVVEDTTLL